MTASGGPRFGLNFLTKVRKHIDQVRRRVPGKIERIPKPERGGAQQISEIIAGRVKKGGGRFTTFAGKRAIVYADGGVSYVFRENGEFWTILRN
ncbi:MAG: hypothetical protein ABSE73_32750 [Planctomycetota bacterium]